MPGKSSRKDNTQEKLFRELRNLAERCGIQVRCEKLSRDYGYRVRSGVCTVMGNRWVIVDRTLPARERLDLLADEIRESVGGESAGGQVEIPADLQRFFRTTPPAPPTP